MGPIEKLVLALKKLPGIGEKSATRLAYSITRWSKDDALQLAMAVTEVKEKVKFCAECSNLAEGDVCSICCDSRRDKTLVCVVEEPQDVQAIEKTGSFHGVYHVLHGALSPLDGIGPDEIGIEALFARLKIGRIRELIIATNPTTSGEATALYISKFAKPFGAKLTRIAFGIPFRSEEHTSELQSPFHL